MHQQHCFFYSDPRGIPPIPPHIAMLIPPFKGTCHERFNGSRQELRAFPGGPIGGFGQGYQPCFVTNMILTQQQKNAEQNEDINRQSRSPSVDSISRLHQQSGGFASHNHQPNQQNSQQLQSDQRRGSFSKDGNSGYYQQQQNHGGYRRQSFNQRGSRSNQRGGNNYQQNGEYSGNNFQQGYQTKQQRNYQNMPQHQSKYSHYFHQPRPIFNSTQEFGSYSARRPSPTAPSSPTLPTANFHSNRPIPAPILLRHVDPNHDKGISGSGSEQEQHHDAKIHQYRSAGTAPGGYSNCSSPYKQPPPPQPPSTPSSTDKRGDTDDRHPRRQQPPPGVQGQYRRGHLENIPAPIELQRKNPGPTIALEITPNSQPTTPSSFERAAQFRAAKKDPHSVDSVDSNHPCFADERMQNALHGVSPQVKSQSQQSVMPIQNDREASSSMEQLKSLQFHRQWQQQMSHYPFIVPLQLDQMRSMKNREQQQLYQQNVHLQRVPPFVEQSTVKHRDSSNDSRCSSEVNTDSMVQIINQLDAEVTGADLDKTPINEKTQKTKTKEVESGDRKKEQSGSKELPRKANRRDSTCSTVSAVSAPCSPAPDESTLTKILPTSEFRGGRGVASPSPPAELLSEPLSRMDVLSEKIWDYHNKVSQTDEMLQRKLHLRDMLYTAISPVFPLSGLYVVGSSLNGFGNNSSDMDLCLMITNKDLDQKNDAVVVLNLILSTLQYEKFVASQKLILAKVPILRIKFAAPFDDITVDLNANNSVAIRNTHLLCYYSSYDWRVRPLVSVVKEWAKRKGINDANKSSFTSYSLVLMVIHYLQCGAPAKVLPNLQQTYPNRFSNRVDVRTLNVTMPLDAVTDDIDQALSEKTTLGELLIGFLDYYANEFNYDRDAISIRQGRRVERAALAARPKLHLNSEGDKETPPPSSSVSSSSLHNVMGSGAPIHHVMSNPHFWRSQWRCVCIEEPFTNSNTAHSIYDEMVFGAIKEAFREAHGELRHNHDLDRLLDCEPIKPSTTNAGAAVFVATYEGERPLAQQPTSIASASLRGINVVPVNNGGGHYHYQQQSHQQLSRQQRPGSNQGFHGSHNRGGNGNNQQNNRRSYNNQSSSNAYGNGSRSSRSTEGYRDSSSPQNNSNNHRQQTNHKNVAGVFKENSNSTSGVTTLAEKKQQPKRDEGNKTKRLSMAHSPELKKPDTEKSPLTPTKANA